jgi:hypothetical protein
VGITEGPAVGAGVGPGVGVVGFAVGALVGAAVGAVVGIAVGVLIDEPIITYVAPAFTLLKKVLLYEPMTKSFSPSLFMSLPPLSEIPKLSPAAAPRILKPVLTPVENAAKLVAANAALLPKITYTIPASVLADAVA